MTGRFGGEKSGVKNLKGVGQNEKKAATRKQCLKIEDYEQRFWRRVKKHQKKPQPQKQTDGKNGKTPYQQKGGGRELSTGPEDNGRNIIKVEREGKVVFFVH